VPGRNLGNTLSGEPKRGIPASRASGRVPAKDGEEDSPHLTNREQTVLRMLVEGKRNQEISQELEISERTVKFHVSGLFAKLGVSSRTQVVSHALRRGLA